MTVNINGEIFEESEGLIPLSNRGFSYGDAVFETLKVVDNSPLFWEKHYFRLMASMRILRMEIPMHFTPEFLESEITTLVKHCPDEAPSYRVKLFVYRTTGGLYTPTSNAVEYAITIAPLNSKPYLYNSNSYNVELFKDHFVSPGLLSTLKTNNKVINVLGSIFATENNYSNALLLNTNKNIVEALNGNVFLVFENHIKTPPLEDGCLRGVMRESVIEILKSIPEFTLEESSISPFELQKADEVFITNTIFGIQPITNYRKKAYALSESKKILSELNLKLNLY